MKKEYSNGEITIVWRPDKCIHSGNCVKGLSQVFKPDSKPWIQVENASTDQLRKQVKECPSGALSYYMNNESASDNQISPEQIKIDVLPNGPLLVHGTVQIKHKDGREEVRETKCSLCRCGASSNKPYCDGTHRTMSFD